MGFDEAVAKAAKEWAVAEDVLVNYLEGRRGATRRMKKRRPPLST